MFLNLFLGFLNPSERHLDVEPPWICLRVFAGLSVALRSASWIEHASFQNNLLVCLCQGNSPLITAFVSMRFAGFFLFI